MYAKVAIPKSAPNALTYAVPVEFEGFTVPGVRVRVPLRKKTVTGVVVEVTAGTDIDPETIRSLIEVVDQEPLLPPHLFFLADFVASYYRCPLGDTLATILPAGLLRADGEVARLTPAGAAADPASLPGKRGTVLSELQAAIRLRVPTLLARAGATGRGPLDALVEAGLATVSSRRRDRSPEAEVAAVQLPDVPIEHAPGAVRTRSPAPRGPRVAGRTGPARACRGGLCRGRVLAVNPARDGCRGPGA